MNVASSLNGLELFSRLAVDLIRIEDHELLENPEGFCFILVLGLFGLLGHGDVDRQRASPLPRLDVIGPAIDGAAELLPLIESCPPIGREAEQGGVDLQQQRIDATVGLLG